MAPFAIQPWAGSSLSGQPSTHFNRDTTTVEFPDVPQIQTEWEDSGSIVEDTLAVAIEGDEDEEIPLERRNSDFCLGPDALNAVLSQLDISADRLDAVLNAAGFESYDGGDLCMTHAEFYGLFNGLGLPQDRIADIINTLRDYGVPIRRRRETEICLGSNILDGVLSDLGVSADRLDTVLTAAGLGPYEGGDLCMTRTQFDGLFDGLGIPKERVAEITQTLRQYGVPVRRRDTEICLGPDVLDGILAQLSVSGDRLNAVLTAAGFEPYQGGDLCMTEEELYSLFDSLDIPETRVVQIVDALRDYGVPIRRRNDDIALFRDQINRIRYNFKLTHDHFDDILQSLGLSAPTCLMATSEIKPCTVHMSMDDLRGLAKSLDVSVGEVHDIAVGLRVYPDGALLDRAEPSMCLKQSMLVHFYNQLDITAEDFAAEAKRAGWPLPKDGSNWCVTNAVTRDVLGRCGVVENKKMEEVMSALRTWAAASTVDKRGSEVCLTKDQIGQLVSLLDITQERLESKISAFGLSLGQMGSSGELCMPKDAFSQMLNSLDVPPARLQEIVEALGKLGINLRVRRSPVEKRGMFDWFKGLFGGGKKEEEKKEEPKKEEAPAEDKKEGGDAGGGGDFYDPFYDDFMFYDPFYDEYYRKRSADAAGPLATRTVGARRTSRHAARRLPTPFEALEMNNEALIKFYADPKTRGPEYRYPTDPEETVTPFPDIPIPDVDIPGSPEPPTERK